MGNALSLHDNGDFTRKFREKQEEIASDAATARTGFTERMAELVQMQQAEILRLQKVLHDNTLLPQRHATAMAVSSVADRDGRQRHVLLAAASDGSHWIMENYRSDLHPRERPQNWSRLPPLPQAGDEADAGQR